MDMSICRHGDVIMRRDVWRVEGQPVFPKFARRLARNLCSGRRNLKTQAQKSVTVSTKCSRYPQHLFTSSLSSRSERYYRGWASCFIANPRGCNSWHLTFHSPPVIPPIGWCPRRPRRKRNLNQPIQKSRPESVYRAPTVGIPGERAFTGGFPMCVFRDQNISKLGRWLEIHCEKLVNLCLSDFTVTFLSFSMWQMN